MTVACVVILVYVYDYLRSFVRFGNRKYAERAKLSLSVPKDLVQCCTLHVPRDSLITFFVVNLDLSCNTVLPGSIGWTEPVIDPGPSVMKMQEGPRMHLKEWLIAQVESGAYEGLCWEDRDKTMFRIPWKHASKKDYKQTGDAALFKVIFQRLYHSDLLYKYRGDKRSFTYFLI